MYIVAIGWAYVVMMMSIAEDTAVAGVMTFLLYGALPVSLILYVGGAGARRRRNMAGKKAALHRDSNFCDQQETAEGTSASGDGAVDAGSPARPGQATADQLPTARPDSPDGR